LGPADVDALTAALRTSPRVAEQVHEQVIPTMDTLKTVAPD
jgi:hypothetical protein